MEDYEEKPRFAVAITLKKDVPNGFNILTRLDIWRAAGVDEAVGLAVKDAMDANPEHVVFLIAKMQVPA